ncbi:MAG: DUF362 domain-containing protein [Planctomycetota bacterium]
MQFSRGKRAHQCPNTARRHSDDRRRRWPRYVLPIAGLVSLMWSLVRVIPKPSRALYPCQRMAFPIASGFVAWLLGLGAWGLAFKKARSSLASQRYVLAAVCAALSVGVLWVTISATSEEAALAQPQAANAPMGTPQGINPGRVVWVHDPETTDWDGPGDGHPWQADHTDPARVGTMMSRAVRELTGKAGDAGAWDAIFKYHNKKRGKGSVGYKPGEKIVVKVNFVGFIFSAKGVDTETYNMRDKKDYMNTSPQMLAALVRQLVGEAGVRQEDIAICDSLAYIPNEYCEIIHKDFPNVKCLDRGGKFGRVKMKPSSVPLHWSCDTQGRKQDYVPTAYAEAEYMINFANLKAHSGSGVTLCAKNHYGSLVRWPVEKGYYDLHSSAFARRTAIYRNLVDLAGHSHLGGKTMLYLLDGLYCGIHPVDMNRGPRRWKSHPFNGDWTSSGGDRFGRL